jgi:ABC-type cobalt transport system substrate-binding protein
MDIYHYHPATGELMGHGIAEPDPLVGGEFLVPAHATVSPPPAAVVGKARCWRNGVWQQVEDNRGVIYSVADGSARDWSELGPVPAGYSAVPVAPPAPTRAELYTAKQTEIRDGAEAMLTALAAEYAPLERQTWDQQAAEAEALQADADAPAPLVRAIAATRGMPVGELAARILANRRAWVAVSGHVVGQRLAYQDTLEATRGLDDAQAAETIQDINPVYTLPEDA